MKKIHDYYVEIIIVVVSFLADIIIPCVVDLKELNLPPAYIGLNIFFAGTLILMYTKVKDINAQMNDLSKLDDISGQLNKFTSLAKVNHAIAQKGDDAFDMFWNICMLKATQGIYQLKNDSCFAINESQIPKFWEHAIIHTDHSWLCTVYLVRPNMWEKSWSVRGLEYQKLGVDHSGVLVKRVFVFENEKDEQTEIATRVMDKQKSYGIQVRRTNLESNIKWEPIQAMKEKIGTFDIAIINGKYLLKFLQNENKEFVTIECTSDMRIIKEVSVLYNRLWDESAQL